MAVRLGLTTASCAISTGLIRARMNENEAKTEALLVRTLRGRDALIASVSSDVLSAASSKDDAEEVIEHRNIPSLETGSRSNIKLIPFKLGGSPPSSSNVSIETKEEQNNANNTYVLQESVSQDTPVVANSLQNGAQYIAKSDAETLDRSTPVTTAALKTVSVRECDAAISAILARPQILRTLFTSALPPGDFHLDDKVPNPDSDSALVERILRIDADADGSRVRAILAPNNAESGETVDRAMKVHGNRTPSNAPEVFDDDINVPLHPAANPLLGSLLEVVREVVQDEALVQETRRIMQQQKQLNDGFECDSENSMIGGVLDSNECGTEKELVPCQQMPSSGKYVAVEGKLEVKGSADHKIGASTRSRSLLSRWEDLCESYQCGICLDLLAAPKLTDCTHSFCGMCVHRYFDSVGGALSNEEQVQLETETVNAAEQLSNVGSLMASIAAATMQREFSATRDSAVHVPHPDCSHDDVVVTCPTCRDVVSTCTYERVLDRDLAKLVDSISFGEEWHSASEEERMQVQALQDDWHARRRQYQAYMWKRTCTGKALRDRVRAARARAAVSDGFTAYSGREGRFLDEYYAGPRRLQDDEDDDDFMYDAAARYVVPLVACILMLVYMAKSR